MILTAIILGAALVAGGSLIAAYMNSLVEWLKRAIRKVSEMISRIVYGTKVFIRKTAEAIKEISKHYSQDEENRWHETVVTREVDESEVPAEFREMARRDKETDITNRLELQLA